MPKTLIYPLKKTDCIQKLTIRGQKLTIPHIKTSAAFAVFALKNEPIHVYCIAPYTTTDMQDRLEFDISTCKTASSLTYRHARPPRV